MPPSRHTLGFAWVALTLALGVHVADEAAHDFLSVYNPAVRAIREIVPWLPLPTFSFGIWIRGLVIAIAILAALTPVAFRGRRWIVLAAHPYAVLMFVNGLQHIGFSVYKRALMPGVWSSPLLLGAGLWLLISARRVLRAPAARPEGNN